MVTLAWYLLKVIICSGILCGYYYVALRNKVFHRWNRFYLLAAVALSLLTPVLKLNVFNSGEANKGTMIYMLRTINSGDDIVIEYSRHSGIQLDTENVIIGIYLIITLVFLSIFFLALYKIARLRRRYPETKMQDINFISTDAKGTPFSFFKSIFWNNAIDLHSRQGQQIFNHEIAHVKEKHSYDKVFMNIVLIFFWMNPFFWLMRKELAMIHEFIADKEALEDSDISAFAEMILQTVYPGQNFSLANNFFHSPLKRRIIMFTKNKNPKASYLSRLLVLPLAAIIFLAFTIKMKTKPLANRYAGKKITVIIDAGHGGSDNGAMTNNINEKDLNLAIARDIKEMNTNQNLNIILSRDEDVNLGAKERSTFANDQKADLFISIHVDANTSKNDLSGLTVIIPKNDNGYLKQSQLLGSAIVQTFRNNYPLPVADDLKQLEQGIWVLKANEYPAILIETGFLSNQKDFDYLINPKNQKVIAENILKGIEKYAEQNLMNTAGTQISNGQNTIDTSKSNVFARLEGNIVIEGRINKVTARADTAIIINSADNSSNSNINAAAGTIILYGSDTGRYPIYFLDGKEISKEKMNTISPGSIESIQVLKGESAIAVYGQKGKNGVILISSKPAKSNTSMIMHANEDINSTEIHLKNENNNNGNVNTPLNKNLNISKATDSLPDKVFTKVENEASFPGGQQAWIKYIVSKIQDVQDSFIEKDFGTCLIKFIVNTDGSISHVEATTMKDTQLAETAMNAIKTGPKWIPATQNGQVVAAYRLQPVTLTNPTAK